MSKDARAHGDCGEWWPRLGSHNEQFHNTKVVVYFGKWRNRSERLGRVNQEEGDPTQGSMMLWSVQWVTGAWSRGPLMSCKGRVYPPLALTRLRMVVGPLLLPGFHKCQDGKIGFLQHSTWRGAWGREKWRAGSHSSWRPRAGWNQKVGGEDERRAKRCPTH